MSTFRLLITCVTCALAVILMPKFSYAQAIMMMFENTTTQTSWTFKALKAHDRGNQVVATRTPPQHGASRYHFFKNDIEQGTLTMLQKGTTVCESAVQIEALIKNRQARCIKIKRATEVNSSEIKPFPHPATDDLSLYRYDFMVEERFGTPHFVSAFGLGPSKKGL